MPTYSESSKEQGNSQAKTWVYLTQLGLRTSAFGTTLAASCVTFTSKQTADVYGVEMDAKYSYSSAFKVYAYVTAIVSLFSLLSLLLTLILRCNRKLLLKGGFRFLFFLHDLAILLVLLGASAGAAAVGYVGKYGNDHAGWVPICDNFNSFCHRISIGVMLGILGVISYLTLVVTSATVSGIHGNQTTTTAAQVQNY